MYGYAQPVGYTQSRFGRFPSVEMSRVENGYLVTAYYPAPRAKPEPNRLQQQLAAFKAAARIAKQVQGEDEHWRDTQAEDAELAQDLAQALGDDHECAPHVSERHFVFPLLTEALAFAERHLAA